MNNAPPPAVSKERWRFAPLAFVLLAILAGQFALFGPSLVGSKVLLPLDILGQRNHYLPHGSGLADAAAENFVLSDLVLSYEPTRQFVARELRAGRFPLWNPYEFTGVPHTMMRFSPFFWLRALTPSPLVLPWVQLLTAMLCGFGFYAFCRKALGLAFWPSATAAWCFPLTAYFVLWQGYGHTFSLAWLPWLLLAMDRTLRRNSHRAGLAVALLTLLTLLSGPLDMAAQELLVAGLYAVWLFFQAHGRRWSSRRAMRAGAFLVLGLGTGLLLAAPELLAMAAYSKTGARMAQRSQGATERPPAGISALPQLVLPQFFGTTENHGISIAPKGHKNQMEGVAAAYASVLAILLLAPLAWCSRRHRHAAVFFTGLAVLGVSWCSNLPGFTALLRLPGLNMMSHNRLVFATALSITLMAAIGLQALQQGQTPWRAWFWAPAALAMGFGLLAATRAGLFPASLETQLDDAIRKLRELGWMRDQTAAEAAKIAFGRAHLAGAVLCGVATICWLGLRRHGRVPGWAIPAISVVMAADLFWFGHGWNPQSDGRLYYPRQPVLEQIAASVSGRVLGYDCLPAPLPQTHELRDLRGYDGIDPKRLVALLAPAAGPSSKALPYAALQWFTPRLTFEPPGAILLPPVLDMLGVEVVIFRGEPPAGLQPAFAGGDYWAMTNPRALPRAFVPKRVEYAPVAKERLAKLSSADFDGREVAYVEEAVALPAESRGRVTITGEQPTHITLSASMETAGLVVLTDLFDAGWRAFRDGEPTQILRVNHAVRGVRLPEGQSVLEFRYWPAGFTTGFRLAGLGLAILLAWVAWLLWSRRQPDVPVR